MGPGYVKTPARFHTDLFRSLFRALRPSRDKEIMKIRALRAIGRKISRSFDTASVELARSPGRPRMSGNCAFETFEHVSNRR